jgi:hypothetical protein
MDRCTHVRANDAALYAPLWDAFEMLPLSDAGLAFLAAGVHGFETTFDVG